MHLVIFLPQSLHQPNSAESQAFPAKEFLPYGSLFYRKSFNTRYQRVIQVKRNIHR